MRVLGLDPSVRRIGWALMTDEAKPVFGVMPLPKSDGELARMMLPARKFLDPIVSDHEDLIHSVCYEAPFLGLNPVHLRRIGALNGLIELVCADAGIDCTEATPAQWRKKILGVTQAPRTLKGQSERRRWIKGKAIIACRSRGWDVRNDDEAEACLIAAYRLGQLDTEFDFYMCSGLVMA